MGVGVGVLVVTGTSVNSATNNPNYCTPADPPATEPFDEEVIRNQGDHDSPMARP